MPSAEYPAKVWLSEPDRWWRNTVELITWSGGWSHDRWVDSTYLGGGGADLLRARGEL